MRMIMLATMLAVVTPAAYAQTYQPAPAQSTPAYPSTRPATYGGPSATDGADATSGKAVGQPASDQPDPDNCGTPDEPKPCPPMPSRPLRHYPVNRPGQ